MSGKRRATGKSAAIGAHPPRLEFTAPSGQTAEQIEDADTAGLVTRFQGGDRDAFAALYNRYFERVYAYLRVIFKNSHEAEEAAQQVFLKALEALPRYELRARRPFRAWLFTVARNYALNLIRDREREELVEPGEIDRRREAADEAAPVLSVLDWITDKDLAFLVERLSLAQRQALLLRFQFGLNAKEIAEVMGRTPDDVRMLQYRAATFLRERLTALGRAPAQREQPEDRMLRRVPEATVLRARRFSLTRGSRR